MILFLILIGFILFGLWCCLAVAKESDERIKGESNE